MFSGEATAGRHSIRYRKEVFSVNEARMQYLALFLLRLVVRNFSRVAAAIIEGSDTLAMLGEEAEKMGVSSGELRKFVDKLRQEARDNQERKRFLASVAA
jgi:hypothetical protein